MVFHGEKFDSNLHTRVFISSQGLPTYEAKDIAHAINKYDKYKFDKSIIITANEQDEYFKVVLCALGHINPEIAKKTKHLYDGLLKPLLGVTTFTPCRHGNEEYCLLSCLAPNVNDSVIFRDTAGPPGFARHCKCRPEHVWLHADNHDTAAFGN